MLLARLAAVSACLILAQDAGARPTDGEDDRFETGYETTQVESDCVSKQDSESEEHSLCVHWVETTDDAPPLTDLDTNDRPDQVDSTLAVIDDVWQAEVVELGYRAPLEDKGATKGQGPDSGTDLYLADVGADGLFGYCAADPPKKGSEAPKTVASYCVIDDDFALEQFPAQPGPTGIDALRVSLAHEFFHAIQAAYEYSDKDRFLSEGTASWVEDVVFDGIDANFAYLEESALQQPEIPLDAYQASNDAQDFEYGAWAFWRFLGELYGDDVIRKIWEKAAPTKTKNLSAIKATAAVVKGKAPTGLCLLDCGSLAFADVFAEFTAWNGIYEDAYQEGAFYAQTLADSHPIDGIYELDEDHPTTGSRQLVLDHLSARRVEFDLSGAPAGDRVRVTLDTADPADGARAFLSTGSQPSDFEVFNLNEKGKATLTSPVADTVLLTLANSSSKLDEEAYRYSAEIRP